MTLSAVQTGLWMASGVAAALTSVLVALVTTTGRHRSSVILNAGVVFCALIVFSVTITGLVARFTPASVAVCQYALLVGTAARFWLRKPLRIRAQRTWARLVDLSGLTVAETAVSVLALVLLVSHLAGFLRPEAPNSDATFYHLALAGNWVTTGNLSVTPISGVTVGMHYPANAETGFAWLMLGSRSHWIVPLWGLLWMAIAAVAIVRSCRSLGVSRLAAACAGLGVLCIPRLCDNVHDAMVDGVLACGVVAALALLLGAVRSRRTSDAMLFGLATGLVLGTKPSGIVYAGLLTMGFGLVFAALTVRRQAGAVHAGRAMLAAALPVLLLGSYWYVRSAADDRADASLPLGVPAPPSSAALYVENFSTTLVASMGDITRAPAQRHEWVSQVRHGYGRYALPVAIGLYPLLLVALVRRSRGTPLASSRGMALTIWAAAGPVLCLVWLFLPLSARLHCGPRFGISAALLLLSFPATCLARGRWQDLVAVVMLVLGAAGGDVGGGQSAGLRALVLALAIGVLLARVRPPTAQQMGTPVLLACLALPVIAVGTGPIAARLLARGDEKWYRAAKAPDFWNGIASDSTIAWRLALEAMPLVPRGATVATATPYAYLCLGRGLRNRVVHVSAYREFGRPSWHDPGTFDNVFWPPRGTVGPGDTRLWARNLLTAGAQYVLAPAGPQTDHGAVRRMRSRPEVFPLQFRSANGELYAVDREALRRLCDSPVTETGGL